MVLYFFLSYRVERCDKKALKNVSSYIERSLVSAGIFICGSVAYDLPADIFRATWSVLGWELCRFISTLLTKGKDTSLLNYNEFKDSFVEFASKKEKGNEYYNLDEFESLLDNLLDKEDGKK